MAELLRTLELTINGRLDGVLHGNHQGLTPGHGSPSRASRGSTSRATTCAGSTGTSSARTNETYVREQIADRDLTAWLVVDASATMQFGTVANDKSQIAMAAAACVGFLTARNQNRLGAVLVAGPSHPRDPAPQRIESGARRPVDARLAPRRRRAWAAPTSPARSTGSVHSPSGAASSP